MANSKAIKADHNVSQSFNAGQIAFSEYSLNHKAPENLMKELEIANSMQDLGKVPSVPTSKLLRYRQE